MHSSSEDHLDLSLSFLSEYLNSESRDPVSLSFHVAKSWCRRGCHLSEERTDLLTMIQMEAPPSGIEHKSKTWPLLGILNWNFVNNLWGLGTE
jgi:hypothetical protein